MYVIKLEFCCSHIITHEDREIKTDSHLRDFDNELAVPLMTMYQGAKQERWAKRKGHKLSQLGLRYSPV